MTKQQKILIVIVVVFVALPLGWWVVTSFMNGSFSGSVIRDKDTGEVFDTEKKDPETGGFSPNKGDAQIFGTEPLIRELLAINGRTGGVVKTIQDAVWVYNKERHNETYKTVTIRPQGLSVSSESVTGELRLGQTETIVPFSAAISKGSDTAVVTINKDGTDHKGTFVYVGGLESEDMLLFNIKQKDYTSSDLVVTSYAGYREAALQHLISLGYNVPDFRITFTNYESVY